MNNRKVHTVWDGGPTVSVPPPMGTPRDDQMQGSLAEKVAELACRVCYDSLGSKRSRSSKDNLEHIIEVGHLSVVEHYHATFHLFLTTSGRGPVCEALSQRPGVYFRFISGGQESVRITMNARAMLEWNRYSEEAAFHQSGYPSKMAFFLGLLLEVEWSSLSPTLFPQEKIGVPPMSSELTQLGIGSLHQVEPEHPSEVWITLYMEGSRGFSHELVRHGDKTAISQRSTRYVNEDESPWDWHPLINAFVAEQAEGWKDLEQGGADVQDHCQAYYRQVVAALHPWLLAKMSEDDPHRKHTARKQARGAARGFLGNALRTAVIFTASVPQWRHMMRMRAADAADAEIRMIFSEALPLLKVGLYGTMFEDLQLAAAGDGLGLSLVCGGAK